ncbi:unnamed protein product [Rhizophagus irregularis]|nr:unnamed protein product [Rhizophagus irregularis]
MSGSMNRNPSSQPPNNNKDGRKDVLNLTVVLSKRNVRKQHKQQQQQTSKQHTMTTRLSSTGPQVVIEQRSYNKSAYQQAASSNNQQDEISMDIDNNKNDNQQSTRQSSNDKQALNLPPEDLDDQQNGKLSFRARVPFNKILVKEKEAQKSRIIQVLDIPLNYKLYEIRAVFSKYGKIEDLYTRVKGLYQHAYIRYEQEDNINIFYFQWSCYLEQHTVRVIPLLLNDESREDRYGFALKLTGLPFGTTGRELNELLKGSGTKSVVISRNPKNYNLLKYAMVYFPNEDVLTEAASLELKIKGSELFWLNLDEKACHVTQALSQFKRKKPSSYAEAAKGEGNNGRR